MRQKGFVVARKRWKTSQFSFALFDNEMEGDPFLPGFHFHPTDVDLVQYLKRKVMGERLHFEFITEIDVYKFDPWDLPGIIDLLICYVYVYFNVVLK